MSSSHAKQSQQWRIFYIRTAVTGCHAQGKEFFCYFKNKTREYLAQLEMKHNLVKFKLYDTDSFLFQEDYVIVVWSIEY